MNFSSKTSVWSPLPTAVPNEDSGGIWLGRRQNNGILSRSSRSKPSEKVFFETTFWTMGYVSSSLEMPTATEMAAIYAAIGQLNQPQCQVQAALELFNLGLGDNGSLAKGLEKLQRCFANRPEVLQRFLAMQIVAAFEFGFISSAKREKLLQISDIIGIPRQQYRAMEAQLLVDCLP